MITTIKLQKETQERLLSLDLATKGKSFDILVNDLITFYEERTKRHEKAMSKWEDSMRKYEEEVVDYERQKAVFQQELRNLKNLVAWAKSKGFKP